MRIRTLAACVGVCLVALAAKPAEPASSPRVGEPFPVLTLPALADAAPQSVARFRGRKVLLHQFASW